MLNFIFVLSKGTDNDDDRMSLCQSYKDLQVKDNLIYTI